MQLYVWNHDMTEKIAAEVLSASLQDLESTFNWQTIWTSKAAMQMPNKVALRRIDTQELLGLMSYTLDERGAAAEIIYLENARHSNSNLLRQTDETKKYNG